MTKILLSVAILLPFSLIIEGGRRQGPIGGWTPQPPHSKSIQNISTYAAGVLSDGANSFLHKKLVHVHEAETQVVAGIKYRITMDLGTTVCRKNEASPGPERENCALHKDFPIERCLVTIWERVWLNEKQVLDFTCREHASYNDYFSEANIAKDQDFHKKQEVKDDNSL